MIDWNDPKARYQLAESVGSIEYNRLFEQHVKNDTVAVINGYGVRPIGTRFGVLMQVIGTPRAFTTQIAAEAYAKTLPPGPLA